MRSGALRVLQSLPCRPFDRGVVLYMSISDCQLVRNRAQVVRMMMMMKMVI